MTYTRQVSIVKVKVCLSVKQRFEWAQTVPNGFKMGIYGVKIYKFWNKGCNERDITIFFLTYASYGCFRAKKP